MKAAAASKPSAALPVSVSHNVMLCRMLCVLNGMDMVAVRQVPVVGGGQMVAFFVMLGGFTVMARSVFMMFRCLRVMVCCFL